MTNTSNTTIDHEVIKKWVTERDGHPARVKASGDEEDIGILRINFLGNPEESLENISWEEFFEKFEKAKLAFLYQDEKSDGEISTFNKLVNR